ncbi:hypothetical protein ACFFGH_17425 [Lysobacter korlensis]|uniref:Uncharacterized protein n=1 Tax=Lysobacter korlensis TaxID=553636 RepID=A0ABV6RS49_9GAMM
MAGGNARRQGLEACSTPQPIGDRADWLGHVTPPVSGAATVKARALSVADLQLRSPRALNLRGTSPPYICSALGSAQRAQYAASARPTAPCFVLPVRRLRMTPGDSPTNRKPLPMKSLIAAAFLALASLSAHAAEPVTASTTFLEYEPVRAGGESKWMTVTFKNNTGSPIDVYGMGWDGPYEFTWWCSNGTYHLLPPHGTCTLSGQFEARSTEPLGLNTGIAGFRLSTGTIIIDIAGFIYTGKTKAGVDNLLSSLTALGLPAASVDQLKPPLSSARTYLYDSYTSNDKKACSPLRTFILRTEQEAVAGRITDWEAAALEMQARAIRTTLGCTCSV